MKSRFWCATAVAVALAAALESPRREWFLPGTAQALFAMDTEAAHADWASAAGRKDLETTAARILAPVGGSIVALDPDMPPQRQRLQLRASADGVRWVMDGQRLGQGRQLAWPPWPGRHVLQLHDRQGHVLDEVRLEVRGAGVRAQGRQKAGFPSLCVAWCRWRTRSNTLIVSYRF